MRSIVWFWTTGIHDPAWVQAFAAIALVALTLVTLVVLYFYARDTHTLAKTSADQLQMLKIDRDDTSKRALYVAHDLVLKIYADLTSILQSLVDKSFGNKMPDTVYPEQWPEAAIAFHNRYPKAINPASKLGIELRNLDFEVKSYFDTSTTDERKA